VADKRRNGIQQKVDKIFKLHYKQNQTGAGTGRAASHWHDGWGSNMARNKVETKEGEGVEFINSITN